MSGGSAGKWPRLSIQLPLRSCRATAVCMRNNSVRRHSSVDAGALQPNQPRASHLQPAPAPCHRQNTPVEWPRRSASACCHVNFGFCPFPVARDGADLAYRRSLSSTPSASQMPRHCAQVEALKSVARQSRRSPAVLPPLESWPTGAAPKLRFVSGIPLPRSNAAAATTAVAAAAAVKAVTP